MSHLAGALRQIAKKSQNPNTLIYQLQLQRAQQKYLVHERLGDGSEGAVALEAPKGELRKNESEQEEVVLDATKQSDPDQVKQRNGSIEYSEVDSKQMGADGDDGGMVKGKG